ncbi:MAG: hypothetical protein E6J53_05155 [Chloroflexi bacterium]|nr:MAG: hypothetical protein E6J53_05155 [Chloroflexota bacterium]
MNAQVLDRELDRIEALWSDGLSEAYSSYLAGVGHYRPDDRPRVALAAALVEVAVRLHGLGGPAAPPTTLLIGDLCLARASRLLAVSAPTRVQVAFAAAIEAMAAAAASKQAPPSSRELLLKALEGRQ